MRFEWDPAKAATNLRKHGISFEEAATAFDDPRHIVYPDETPNVTEERFILLGYSSRARLLLVVHAVRSPATIRLISARKSSRTDRRNYEEGP